MTHIIIIIYAHTIELFRKLLLSNNSFIQLIFMPGLNSIRAFNSNARAYYEFYKAKKNVPAYKKFLKSKNFNRPSFNGLVPQINEIPIIDKDNYIKIYPLRERCINGALPNSGLVIDESSGSSGMPTNWVRGEKERKRNAKFIKFGIKKLFGKDPLFIINAFALGAWATGMNITMSCLPFAKVKSLGPDIEKIKNTLKEFGNDHKYLIMGYPPFLKLFVDQSEVNFNNYDISFIFGGEPMSEGMRDYLFKKGIKKIYSSYGASDLELNISSENPFTISLRRLIRQNEELKKKLIKFTGALPMIFQYNPSDFLIEINKNNEIITTICRPDYVAPKIRYNIHDKGHIMQYQNIVKIITKLNLQDKIRWSKTDLPVLFHYGRSNMTVSFYGSNISPNDIQDSLYRIAELAKIVNSYFLDVEEDADGNKNLKIYFELIKNVNPKQKTKDFHKLFFDALAKTNQDFKKSKEMINDNKKMELIFCKFNTKFFAENDIKIKAKYIH